MSRSIDRRRKKMRKNTSHELQLEHLEGRILLSGQQGIMQATLIDDPDPVTADQDLTLTLQAGTDPQYDDAEFYRSENPSFNPDNLQPDDTKLPEDQQQVSFTGGGWEWQGTADWNAQEWHYFAFAVDTDTDPDTRSEIGHSIGTVNARPNVGSLTGSPEPVDPGDTITLTASNVTDPEGNLERVDFYRDADGDGVFQEGQETLLSSDTSSQGGWTLSNVDVLAESSYYYAIAHDTGGAASSPTRGFVNLKPTIGLVEHDPNPIQQGEQVTFSATNVNDIDGTVTTVEFYRDTNNTGNLERDADQFLGTGSNQGGGVWEMQTTAGWDPDVSPLYFGVAQDNGNPDDPNDAGDFGDPVATLNENPYFDEITGNPDPVAVNESLLLEALGVSDSDGYVTDVIFSAGDTPNFSGEPGLTDGLWPDFGFPTQWEVDSNGSDGWSWDISGNNLQWTIRSMEKGDFDQDGDDDLALVADVPPAMGNDFVSVLMNNGQGTFRGESLEMLHFRVGQPHPDPTSDQGIPFMDLQLNPVDLVVGDFNNDGAPDIATANSGVNHISVLINDGSGGFDSHQNIRVNFGGNDRPVHPDSITTADYTGDGNLDLAVASSRDDQISLLWGDGNGGFNLNRVYQFDAVSNPPRVAINPEDMTSADLDFYGGSDIITTSQNGAMMLWGVPGRGGAQMPHYFDAGNKVGRALETGITGGQNQTVQYSEIYRTGTSRAGHPGNRGDDYFRQWIADGDVDMYHTMLDQGQSLTIDLDRVPEPNTDPDDVYVYVYRVTENTWSLVDSNEVEDDLVYDFSVTAAQAGHYFVAVAGNDLTPDDDPWFNPRNADHQPGGGSDEEYNLTLTAEIVPNYNYPADTPINGNDRGVPGSGRQDFSVIFNDVNDNGEWDSGEDVWANNTGGILNGNDTGYDGEMRLGFGSEAGWQTDASTAVLPLDTALFRDIPHGDEDPNGFWDYDEEVWIDENGDGDYDAGEEPIWDGGDGSWDTSPDDPDDDPQGEQIVAGNVYVSDVDGSGDYTAPDEVWVDPRAQDNQQYDGIREFRLYEGNDGWTTGDGAEGVQGNIYWFGQVGESWDAFDFVWADDPDDGNQTYDGAGSDDVPLYDDTGWATGIQADLYFYDANSNALWDSGERVWADIGSLPGHYDSGDRMIVGNAPGVGTPGRHGNIYYHDQDGDSVPDPKEGVWAEIVGGGTTPAKPFGAGDSVIAADFVDDDKDWSDQRPDVDLAFANSLDNTIEVLLGDRHDESPIAYLGLYPDEDMNQFTPQKYGTTDSPLSLATYNVDGDTNRDSLDDPDWDWRQGSVEDFESQRGFPAYQPYMDLIVTNADGSVDVLLNEGEHSGNFGLHEGFREPSHDADFSDPTINYTINDYGRNGPFNFSPDSMISGGDLLLPGDFNGDGLTSFVVGEKLNVATLTEAYPFHMSDPADNDQYDAEIPQIAERFGFKNRYNIMPWDQPEKTVTYYARAIDEDYGWYENLQLEGYSRIASIDMVINQRPQIWTLTDNRREVLSSSSDALTLKAHRVQDLDGSVDNVEFYLDTDGDTSTLDPQNDRLISVDNNGVDGWKITVAPGDLSWNVNSVFWARAVDNHGDTGEPVDSHLNEKPTIGDLFVDGEYQAGTEKYDQEIVGSPTDGVHGTRGNILFRDSMFNNRWDPGEEIWADGSMSGKPNGLYDEEIQIEDGNGVWDTTVGTTGIQDGSILFRDADNDGRFDRSEEVWLDTGSVTGAYDLSDEIIWNGGDEQWNTSEGSAGIEGNVYWNDIGVDGSFDPGTDEIWADALIGTAGEYENIQEARVWAGEDGYWDTTDGAEGQIGNLLFEDNVITNGVWDSGEAVWAEQVQEQSNIVLTAVDVQAGTWSGANNVRKVQFYRDSNFNGVFDPQQDELFTRVNLADIDESTPSNRDLTVPPENMSILPSGWGDPNVPDWRIVVDDVDWEPGSHKYFAVAQDSADSWSAAVSARNEVTNIRPIATSLQDSPDPVTRGEEITLTAGGVDDPFGEVHSVSFFLDDGDGVFERNEDRLLGIDQNDTGGWSLTKTVDWLPGEHTYFAQATDNYGAVSNHVQTVGEVNGRPIMGGEFDEAELENFAANADPRSITTGDFNQDENLDLAVANSSLNSVSVLYGRGDGTFEAPETVTVSDSSVVFVTTADINSDGRMDLVTANQSNNGVSVLINTASGGFTEETHFTTDITPNELAVGDFNRDNNLDIAIAGSQNGQGKFSIRWQHADGDLTFDNKAVYDVGGTDATSIVADRIDTNDSRLDVAVTIDDGSNGYVSVWKGQPNDTFAEIESFVVGDTPSSLVTGDWNEDGVPDLAVAVTNDNAVKAYAGIGDGTFTRETQVYAGTDGWNTADNANGLQADFLFADTSGDGNWQENEEIWLDADGNGEYDTGETQIHDGGDGQWDTAAGTAGVADDFLFADANGDENWQSGEDIWLDSNPDQHYDEEYTQTWGPISGPVHLATGYFDQNGLEDLAVTSNSTDTVHVLLANGGRVDGIGNYWFSSNWFYNVGSGPRASAAGDFDADGVVDLVVANEMSDDVSYLPGIGSLIHSPDSVGEGETITFEARNVRDPDGDNITDVVFYRDTNGTDVLEPTQDEILSQSLVSGPGGNGYGTWVWQGPADWEPGEQVYFAVAEDARGGKSRVARDSDRLENPQPMIGDLVDDPDPVTEGYQLKLIAQNVVDQNGTVEKVEFYLDDGDQSFEPEEDTLLGTSVTSEGGNFVLTNQVNWAPGTRTYFARAQDNLGAWSEAASESGYVNDRPEIDELVASPNPLPLSELLTLTANGVTDEDGSVQTVQFYRDTNGDGVFQENRDDIVGTDPSGANGWSISFDASTDAQTFFARANDGTGWSFAASVNVNRRPAVGELEDSPSTVNRLSNLRLDATNVYDVDGTVDAVEFYRDIDKDGILDQAEMDQPLGLDTTSGDGWFFSGQVDWPGGQWTYFARAKDNQGVWTRPEDAASTLGVVNSRPEIDPSAFEDTPDPVTRGEDLTLRILEPATTGLPGDFLFNDLEVQVYDGADGVWDTNQQDAGTEADFLFGDVNQDGIWQTNEEVWFDANSNGKFDVGEAQLHDGGDGQWNTAPQDSGIESNFLFNDFNQDGTWQTNEEVWFDAHGNGVYETTWQADEEIWLDANGNGRYDSGEAQIHDGNDGSWDTADGTAGLSANFLFTDANSDGSWQQDEEVWLDGNGNGQFDIGETFIYDGNDGTRETHGSLRDIDGSIVQVEFYRDKDNDGELDPDEDALLGSDTVSPGDVFSITPNTAGWNLGEQTYFARAKDNNGAWSSAVSTTGRINGRPSIGNLDVAPDPVSLGEDVTLTAVGVSDDRGITQIAFYHDADGNGSWDSTELVGTVYADTVIPGLSQPTRGVQGAHADLLFADGNGDGRWTSGEEIWTDQDGDGVYDDGETQVYDGGDGSWDTLADDAGIAGNLLIADGNGNGTWDSGEAVWAERGEFNYGQDTLVPDTMLPDYGTLGARDDLLFNDANNDGRWDPDEEIWVDGDGDGVYDSGETQVYDGDDGSWDTPVDGAGIAGNLLFDDANSNGQWDSGEGIWAEAGRFNSFKFTMPTDGYFPVQDTVVPGTPEPAFGRIGIDDTLLFHDADSDGEWDTDEEIWQESGTPNGQYDSGETQIYDGGDGAWDTVPGDAGIAGNVQFADVNGNQQWDSGESVWADRDEFPPGVNTYFARAQDTDGVWSDAVENTGVVNKPPEVATLDAPADIDRGDELTLVARGVTDFEGDEITDVAFFADTDGDGEADADERLDDENVEKVGPDEWSWEGSSFGLPAGTITYMVKASDPFGTGPVTTAIGDINNIGPEITGSLTDSPDPVTRPADLMLQVSGVVDKDKAGIDTVHFYRDDDGDGVLDSGEELNNDLVTNVSDGTWQWVGSTLGFPLNGTSRQFSYFAQAEDSNGSLSAPTAPTVGTVLNQDPEVQTLTATPERVSPGEVVNLTASGMSDEDGSVVEVAFYEDLDGDGTADPGEYLGSDTDGTDGWTWEASTADAPYGPLTYLAVAVDNNTGRSDPATDTVTISLKLIESETLYGNTTISFYDTDHTDGISSPEIAWGLNEWTPDTDVLVDTRVLNVSKLAGIRLYGDGTKTDDLGITVSGRNGLQNFLDLRTGASEYPVSFLAVEQDVAAARFANGLEGAPIDGFMDEAGWTLPSDLDDDGEPVDQTGFYAGSIGQTLLHEDVTGDIVSGWDITALRSAGDLPVDVYAANSIGRLVSYGDIGGLKAENSINVAYAVGGDFTGDVVTTNGNVNTLAAVENGGHGGGFADVEVGGKLGVLRAVGGSVDDIDVTGDINAVAIVNGDLTGSLTTRSSNLNVLRVDGGDILGDVSINGRAGNIVAVSANGTGGAIHGDIDVQSDVNAVYAVGGSVKGDVATGGMLNTLAVVNGDLQGSVTTGMVTGQGTLKALRIKGGDLNGDVTVNGQAGTIAAALQNGNGGDINGDIGATSGLSTIIASGDLRGDVTVDNGNLGRIDVRGRIRNSKMNVGGQLSALTASKGIQDAEIFVTDLASQIWSGGDFQNSIIDADQLGKVLVKGTISGTASHRIKAARGRFLARDGNTPAGRYLIEMGSDHIFNGLRAYVG